jgi:hypothetical protein
MNKWKHLLKKTVGLFLCFDTVGVVVVYSLGTSSLAQFPLKDGSLVLFFRDHDNFCLSTYYFMKDAFPVSVSLEPPLVKIEQWMPQIKLFFHLGVQETLIWGIVLFEWTEIIEALGGPVGLLGVLAVNFVSSFFFSSLVPL